MSPTSRRRRLNCEPDGFCVGRKVAGNVVEFRLNLGLYNIELAFVWYSEVNPNLRAVCHETLLGERLDELVNRVLRDIESEVLFEIGLNALGSDLLSRNLIRVGRDKGDKAIKCVTYRVRANFRTPKRRP